MATGVASAERGRPGGRHHAGIPDAAEPGLRHRDRRGFPPPIRIEPDRQGIRGEGRGSSSASAAPTPSSYDEANELGANGSMGVVAVYVQPSSARVDAGPRRTSSSGRRPGRQRTDTLGAISRATSRVDHLIEVDRDGEQMNSSPRPAATVTAVPAAISPARRLCGAAGRRQHLPAELTVQRARPSPTQPPSRPVGHARVLLGRCRCTGRSTAYFGDRRRSRSSRPGAGLLRCFPARSRLPRTGSASRATPSASASCSTGTGPARGRGHRARPSDGSAVSGSFPAGLR